MTIDDHARAAREHRDHAHAAELDAHLAAERDDPKAAAEHLEDARYHLAVAHHHEVAATHARLAQLS